ncbi:MAG: GNAT family N-acetyltransferase [Nitrospirae bacterium]|nr:GNAT family N-acetyltransferase [Nitrospirota bacterium]
MEIKKFNPFDWPVQKDGIMHVERECFPPELYMSEEETKESICDENCYAYLAFDGDKIIGNSYGNLLSSVNENWFEGHWDPKTYLNYGKKVMYITSTGVLPEYRGKGVARRLKYAMLQDLKKDGFNYVIGHSHAGTMVTINKLFNAEIIQEFPKWFGSKWTNYLYEINIQELPTYIPVKHLKQLYDYDCGLASLSVLLNMDKVLDAKDYSNQISLELGMNHEQLIKVGNILNVSIETIYNAKINDIENIILSGKLVLVNYQSKNEGHYSVVFGFDNTDLFIMDVETGEETMFNKHAFNVCWYSDLYGKRWMGWII